LPKSRKPSPTRPDYEAAGKAPMLPLAGDCL
jgi:hypothetical protein